MHKTITSENLYHANFVYLRETLKTNVVKPKKPLKIFGLYTMWQKLPFVANLSFLGQLKSIYVNFGLEFWPIFGQFWGFLPFLGQLWSFLITFTHFRNFAVLAVLVNFGQFWSILGHFGLFWDTFAFFWATFFKFTIYNLI